MASRTVNPYREQAREERGTAFTRLIQRDPTVCNNCFRRTHDAITRDIWSGVFGWWTYEVWDGRRDRTEIAHHDRMTFGLTRSCVCGTITNSTKRRPIPTARAMDYARNLSTTLSEKDIKHDRDVLLDTVRTLKADPDVQGKEDTHVYTPAVRRAIAAT